MKWWQRRNFSKLRVARVTVDDLKAMLDRGESPIVLDVRTRGARRRDLRRIPTAIVAAPGRSRATARARAAEQSGDRLYCT
jgi:DNA-binding transcriptional regulator LsrR (DeoR family)